MTAPASAEAASRTAAGAPEPPVGANARAIATGGIDAPTPEILF